MPERLEDSCGLRPGSGHWVIHAQCVGHCEISVAQSDSICVKKTSDTFFKDLSGRRKGSFFPYFISFFPISKLQLLADQNLKFIDPFCKIAAKTKE